MVGLLLYETCAYPSWENYMNLSMKEECSWLAEWALWVSHGTLHWAEPLLFSKAPKEKELQKLDRGICHASRNKGQGVTTASCLLGPWYLFSHDLIHCHPSQWTVGSSTYSPGGSDMHARVGEFPCLRVSPVGFLTQMEFCIQCLAAGNQDGIRSKSAFSVSLLLPSRPPPVPFL